MRNTRLFLLFILISCSPRNQHKIEDTKIVADSSLKDNSKETVSENELVPIKVLPRDDSKNDIELRNFIKEAINAIDSKDTNVLFSKISPSIILSYQDGKDYNNIRNLSKLCKNDTILTTFNKELKRSLSLGLIKQDSTYYFPYVSQLPWYKDDSGFTTDLCSISNNVNVYEKPDSTSNIVGHLDYEVVKVDYEKIEKFKNKISGVSYYDLTKDWYYIIKYDGKLEGFVASKYLYSNMGYRGTIKKTQDKYLITSFVSGD